MNWLLLLLLVPLILVPIVLLGGFAGCAQLIGLDDVQYATPDPPANLLATATGPSSIRLDWQDTSGASVTFDIDRVDPKQTLTDKKSGDEDVGLNDGTDFAYTVRADRGGASSGPSNEAKATTEPNAPTNLVATPEGTDKIKLTWNHVTESNKNVAFKLIDTLKTAPGGTTVVPVAATKVNPITFAFVHTVATGSEHEFQVIAMVARFDDSPTIPQKVDSDPSVPPVIGKPLPTSLLAFQAAPGASTNQPNTQGFCIVQMIPKALLQNGGTKVKITLRGTDPALPNAGPLTLNRIYLSQVDHAPGKDPYDSLAIGPSGLTRVVNIDPPFSELPATLAAGESKTLSVPYTLIKTEDLLIAFDIKPTVGQGNLRFVPQPGAVSYAKGPPAPGLATEEAAVPDRTPGYISANNNLYLIERIEVS